MFEYGVVDWAEIAGLMLPFSIVVYISLVLVAKLFVRIFGYDFHKEWPAHWKVIALSFLTSPGAVAFWIYNSKEQRFAFDRFLALGEPPSLLTLCVCGVLGVVLALVCLSPNQKQTSKSED
jgi:hypothetical protein